MYRDEEFEELEQTEREITLEHIAAMLLLLGDTRESIRQELISFYYKYGKDGVVTYNEARKWISIKDRRRRMNAFIAIMALDFDTLRTGLVQEFKILESSIKEIELDFFEVEEVDDLDLGNWGQDESNWKERLDEDIALWIYYLTTDFKRALLHADTLEDVLKQFDKRFVSIEKVLHRLGITESTAFTTMARKEIFKLFGVAKYRYYARIDERTCETCGELHDMVFPIEAYEVGVTAPPIHPSCRCWTVPIWD